MRDGDSPFSDDYETARNRFLAAADRFGVHAASIRGGIAEMTADIARLGSPETPGLIIVCGGGRGAGTLAGCGAALYGLSRDVIMDLPARIGLILVHAANPEGPVWSRKQSGAVSTPAEPQQGEERQFPDLTESRFREFAEATQWGDGQTSGIRFDQLANRPLASLAEAAFDRADLDAAVAPLLERAESITLLDVRTGPGAFRQHHIYSCDPEGSAGRQRAERWLHAVPPADSADPEAYSPDNCSAGLAITHQRAKRTRIILELGTDSMAGMLGGDGRLSATTTYPRSKDWRNDATRAIGQTLKKIYMNMMSDIST